MYFHNDCSLVPSSCHIEGSFVNDVKGIILRGSRIFDDSKTTFYRRDNVGKGS